MNTLLINRNQVYLLAIISSLYTLTLVQDLLRAMLRDYHFYLSEAMLFAIFWWIFLPLLRVRKMWLERFATSVPVFRSMVMTVLLTALHLLSYGALLFLLSWLLLDHTYALRWSLRYAVSDMLYFALGGYGLLELASRWSVTEPEESPTTSQAFPTSIPVSSKEGTLYLETGEIVLLRSASPYVEVRANGKKYLEATSLKALAEVLDPANFVRIHKSCIVNLSFVRELKSRGNGDYDLMLRNCEEVRMSRNYVAGFKRGMQTHQLSPG